MVANNTNVAAGALNTVAANVCVKRLGCWYWRRNSSLSRGHRRRGGRRRAEAGEFVVCALVRNPRRAKQKSAARAAVGLWR